MPKRLLAIILIVLGFLIFTPLASAQTSPLTETYTNTSNGQVIVHVIMKAKTADDAAAMVKLANQSWLNMTFKGMTIARTDPFVPELLKAWKADRGTSFEGTFDSRPSTDLCTACPSLLLLVQRGTTVHLFVLISTRGPLGGAEVQPFADYAGKAILSGKPGVDPPDGFTALDTSS
ncbi:MAG: hypothetical protein ACR2M1_10475 [Gemmatimonadaceae bacterium]